MTDANRIRDLPHTEWGPFLSDKAYMSAVVIMPVELRKHTHKSKKPKGK